MASDMAGGFQVRTLREGVTAVDARSARTFARHAHDEFGVGLITRGAQRSWSGRGPVEACAGDVITVNPAEAHDGAAVGPERAWAMLYLAPAVIAPVVSDLSEGGFTARELHAPVIRSARAAQLFRAARAAAARRDDAAFDERLPLLLAMLLGAEPTAPADAPRALARARERIDDDPAHVHPLAELASLAGVSRFRTVRGFARLTGLTPHAYVVQRRLDLARRLIRGGRPLAEVAAEAGFADQSHLNRAFVARYGFTPGAYARALRR